MDKQAQCRKCRTDFSPTPSQRRKSNWICRPCARARSRETVAAAKAEGRWDADKARRSCREWRERNIEDQRARERERHARDRTTSRAKALAYQKANRAKVCARVVARERHVKLATPAWADKAAILSFYETCPPGHHVDHVVPLKGRTVCGLHVENNLQHLPASQNKQKGNRFDGW